MGGRKPINLKSFQQGCAFRCVCLKECIPNDVLNWAINHSFFCSPELLCECGCDWVWYRVRSTWSVFEWDSRGQKVWECALATRSRFLEAERSSCSCHEGPEDKCQRRILLSRRKIPYDPSSPLLLEYYPHTRTWVLQPLYLDALRLLSTAVCLLKSLCHLWSHPGSLEWCLVFRSHLPQPTAYK